MQFAPAELLSRTHRRRNRKHPKNRLSHFAMRCAKLP